MPCLTRKISPRPVWSREKLNTRAWWRSPPGFNCGMIFGIRCELSQNECIPFLNTETSARSPGKQSLAQRQSILDSLQCNWRDFTSDSPEEMPAFLSRKLEMPETYKAVRYRCGPDGYRKYGCRANSYCASISNHKAIRPFLYFWQNTAAARPCGIY